MKIVFEEEKKVNDAGVLLREFIHLICKEVFKAEKGKFFVGKLIFLIRKRVVCEGGNTRYDLQDKSKE